MGRRIVTRAEEVEARKYRSTSTRGITEEEAAFRQAAAPVEQPDDYAAKILKLIPAEIVAAYVAADAAIGSVTDIPTEELTVVRWIVFLSLWVMTPLYLNRVLPDKDLNSEAKKARKLQIAISVGAFFVWVFTLGGPFTAYAWYHPVYGTIMLLLYTLLMPILFGKES
jgi:hypothetical protein